MDNFWDIHSFYLCSMCFYGVMIIHMYKTSIVIKSKGGEVIISKDFLSTELDGILRIDPPELYAEAQQAELSKGLDILDNSEEFDTIPY